MSFSYNVKQELSQFNNLADKEIVKAECNGYLTTKNAELQKGRIRFSTESEYNINRFGKLLDNLGKSDYKIGIQGKNYIISYKEKREEIELYKDIESQLKNNKENIDKALMRGIFLGSGSMNEPEKQYHLEMMIKNENLAITIQNRMKKYYIELKILNKTKGVLIYTKEGEEISKFLAFLGASKSVLKFEEVRVLRDMRNQVNRMVNCETANLNKTVQAAIKQIEAIQILKKSNKFDSLRPELKEIANLRERHPEASLIELGKMLKKPIGKSGVNHRLKNIEKMAEEIL